MSLISAIEEHGFEHEGREYRLFVKKTFSQSGLQYPGIAIRVIGREIPRSNRYGLKETRNLTYITGDINAYTLTDELKAEVISRASKLDNYGPHGIF